MTSFGDCFVQVVTYSYMELESVAQSYSPVNRANKKESKQAERRGAREGEENQLGTAKKEREISWLLIKCTNNK